MDTELKYTLITGGSRGIGKELARECAGRGMNLLLVARGKGDLEDTAAEIRQKFPVAVHTLQADLKERDGPRKVVDWCKKEGFRVNILINNAGLAGTASFEDSGIEYSDERILVNIRALVLLTRLFLPELKSHPEAYILNIGSLSAYYPTAYKSVYAASKAFVLSFTRALKQELRDGNVSVTVVNPNGVPTSADIKRRIDSYSRWTTRFVVMDASRLARISVNKMLMGKLVVVPGFPNRILVLVSRILPQGLRDRWLSRIIRKELSG